MDELEDEEDEEDDDEEDDEDTEDEVTEDTSSLLFDGVDDDVSSFLSDELLFEYSTS